MTKKNQLAKAKGRENLQNFISSTPKGLVLILLIGLEYLGHSGTYEIIGRQKVSSSSIHTKTGRLSRTPNLMDGVTNEPSSNS